MALEAVLAEARAAQGGRRQRGSAWARPGASPRTATSSCLRHGRRRQGAGAGDLRHARHADRRQAQQLKACRPRLLQSQPRHLAGILRRDHHHPHLPGPPGHARPCARRRHPRLLRRHRRHGRDARRSRRHDCDAGEPAGASGIGADQYAGARRRHAAAGEPALDRLEFVRTIAVARITMPRSVVRLSAGREDMSEETQALCFLAGANSIFYGPKLLTTPIPTAIAIRI